MADRLTKEKRVTKLKTETFNKKGVNFLFASVVNGENVFGGMKVILFRALHSVFPCILMVWCLIKKDMP
jgi:hypothetical protein